MSLFTKRERSHPYSIVITIVLVLAIHPGRASGVETVRLGLYENSPVVCLDQTGNPSCVFGDLISEIAKRESWNIELTPGTWQECLDNLTAGKIDILAGIAFTPGREAQYQFNKETVMTNYGQVYTSPDSEIQSLLDLEKKRVAVLKGDIHANRFKELTDKFQIRCRVIELDHYEDVFRLLDSREVDAGVTNRFWGHFHSPDYDVSKSPIVFNPIGIRFAAPASGSSRLLEAIDRHLAAMKKNDDSLYYKSLNRWFNMGGTEFSFPNWAVFLFFFLMGGICILLILNTFLKKRVRAVTRELLLESEKLGREIVERKKVQVALEDSNERFNQIADNISECFWLVSADWQEMLYINAAYETIWGRRMADLYQNPLSWVDAVPEPDRQAVLDYIGKISGRPDPGVFPKYRVIRPDQSVRWISARYFPIVNAAGEVYRVAGISQDITEREQIEEYQKRSLKEKEVLLHEIHHRVKNNMQVIISLLRLQADRISDQRLRDIFLESQSRIYAMAAVHQTLHQSENLSHIDLKQYISILSRNIFHSYRTDGGKIKLISQIHPLGVRLDQSYPIGLVINELLSNALKYAFPEDREGEIIILGELTTAHWVKLVIGDNGIGIPPGLDWRKTDSLGLQMVRTLVEIQLGGTIDLDDSRGTRWEIVFPCDSPPGPPGP